LRRIWDNGRRKISLSTLSSSSSSTLSYKKFSHSPTLGSLAGIILKTCNVLTAYPLVICYIAMVSMAHRNRWFMMIYLLKMVDLSIIYRWFTWIYLLKMVDLSMAM
jgi:hypothetical protein